jgi:hypothetical protein
MRLHGTCFGRPMDGLMVEALANQHMACAFMA